MASTTTAPSPPVNQGSRIRHNFAARLGQSWRPRAKAAAGAEAIEHDQLVSVVRDRATKLGIDVPVRSFGAQPKIVFYEPSGISRHLYPDEASLEAAIRRRLTTRSISAVGLDTPTIDHWPAARLRQWLADHDTATNEAATNEQP